MAGVITLTEEFASTVPAEKLFDSLLVHCDNLIPKIVPQAIKSIDTVQGDGGPGTIKTMNFTDGKYVKTRVDAVDKEKLTYTYTMTEGDALTGNIEAIEHEIQMEATADGGSKGTNITKYFPKPGKEIKEEEVKDGQEKATFVFKIVEAYLIANPNAF